MSVPDYAHDAALANPDEVESGEEIWCVTFEARRLGRSWDPSDPDMDVVEAVEADLTPVGWTTLECERALGRSAFIPSWEWTAREVWDDERHLIEERALGEIEEGEDW